MSAKKKLTGETYMHVCTKVAQIDIQLSHSWSQINIVLVQQKTEMNKIRFFSQFHSFTFHSQTSFAYK